MIEITVNVTGLDGLVEALKGLAVKQGEAIQMQQTYQAPPIQQMAPPPTYQAPQQMTPPVTAPMDQPVQQQPMQPPVQPQQSAPLPTADIGYSYEQLAVAATSLTDAGKIDAVRALLNRFGIQTMMQLPREQYGAFANELRQMGAKL